MVQLPRIVDSKESDVVAFGLVEFGLLLVGLLLLLLNIVKLFHQLSYYVVFSYLSATWNKHKCSCFPEIFESFCKSLKIEVYRDIKIANGQKIYHIQIFLDYHNLSTQIQIQISKKNHAKLIAMQCVIFQVEVVLLLQLHGCMLCSDVLCKLVCLNKPFCNRM